jgi:RF-1 domain
MLAVMPSCHPAMLPIDDLLADCDVRRERRSGPGGQHRNKVETAVVVTHRPTGIAAEANERRSQSENKQRAIRRLRLKLAVEVRSGGRGREPVATGDVCHLSEQVAKDSRPRTVPETPSELWQQRSAGGRIVVSTSHDDFAALLAEALDAVAVADFDIAAAARSLSVSTSQLAGLLRREPPAWRLVNDARRVRGLRALH